MNKKYIITAVALLSFSHVLLPLAAFTAEQEQVRLSTLWNLHANNALTIAQFVENGHSIATVIERDIALLEKDGELALKRKASAEGFISNKVIPGFFKGVAIGSGAVAVLGLVAAAIGFSAGDRVWNQTDNKILKNISGFADSVADIFGKTAELAQCKLEYLTEHSSNKGYNKVALGAAGLSPFVAVASLVSAGISKYAFNKNASWNTKNADFIQEKQDQYNRDQAIIAKLKQLKYDNGL